MKSQSLLRKFNWEITTEWQKIKLLQYCAYYNGHLMDRVCVKVYVNKRERERERERETKEKRGYYSGLA